MEKIRSFPSTHIYICAYVCIIFFSLKQELSLYLSQPALIFIDFDFLIVDVSKSYQ